MPAEPAADSTSHDDLPPVPDVQSDASDPALDEQELQLEDVLEDVPDGEANEPAEPEPVSIQVEAMSPPARQRARPPATPAVAGRPPLPGPHAVAVPRTPSSPSGVVVPAPSAPAPRPPPTSAEVLAELVQQPARARIDVYRRELAIEDDPGRRAVLLHEIGRLLEREEHDEAGARQVYRQALEADLGLQPNLWALRRQYERGAQWQELVTLLSAEAAVATGPRARAEALVEKGHLLEDRIGDGAAAEQAYREALAEDASSLAALMALERRVLRGGDLEQLAWLLQRMVEATSDPGRKTELLIELAAVEGQVPGALPGAAFARLREAFALGVAPLRVLDELERLAVARGDTSDLLSALDVRAAMLERDGGPDAAERLIDLRRQQAALCGPSEPERAGRYLEGALALAPEEPLLLLDLAELAADGGRHGEQAELLARVAAHASPKVAARLALVRARALRLAGRPDEAEALEQGAGDDARVRVLLCAERQERAAVAGDVAALGRAHREEADIALAAGDARWATRALAAWAALRERDGDAQAALGAWREALAALPGDRVALDGLDAALERGGLHAERAAVLRQKLEGAAEDERAELLEELVELHDGPLADPGGALAALAELCTLRADGAGGEEAAPRARAVEIARRAGRWEEAAAHLARLAAALERAGAASEAVEAELERARLLEELVDAAAALGAVESALRIAPEHAGAQAERRRLLGAAGRWQELADSLAREAEQAPDRAHAARLLVELAELLRYRLGRPADAARTYRQLAGQAPDEAVAHRVLGHALAEEDDPLVLARWLETATPPRDGQVARPDQAARDLRLGELYEDRIGHPLEAEAAFARAVGGGGDGAVHAAFGRVRAAVRSADAGALDAALSRLAPFTGGAMAAALSEERAALAAAAGDAVGTEERLDDAVRLDPRLLSARFGQARLAARLGQPDRLAEALSALADTVPSGPLAATLRLRALTLAAATGRAQDGAAAAALAAQPGPEGAVSGAVVASVIGSEPEALAQRGPVEGQQVGLAVERIEALLERGRLAAANALLVEQLARAPRDPVLLELLRRLARAGGDRLGEARAQQLLAGVLRSRERAAVLLDEAARTLEELGAKGEAASAWRSLCALQPERDEPFVRAAALLSALDDAAALDEHLTAWLARTRAGSERAPLLVERGLLRSRAGRAAASAADLDAALAIDPDEPRALERLSALRAEAGDRARAAVLLERRIGRAEVALGADQRRALLLRLLDLQQDLGSVDAVRRTLGQLVPLAPEDAGLRERAAAMLERLGDARGALEHHQARALLGDAGAGRTEARITAELRSAIIYRDAIGDAGRARDALERVLAIAPLHLEALAALVPLCGSPAEARRRDAALHRAVREAQSAIDATPSDPRPYLALEQVLTWLSDDDGRQLARQAAAVVEGRPIPPREGAPEPGAPLPPELFAGAFAVEARGAAFAIWREAEEAAQRLLGPDPDSLGIARSTRQSERNLPAAWQAIDRIARAVGATPYALHAVPGPPGTCAVAGDALALGSAFAGGPGPHARFEVALRLALLRDRLAPLEKVGDEALQLFFAACARVADAPWSGADGLAPARVEEHARQVGKILDRRARKALVALAPRFAEVPAPAAWRRAVLAGASRVALAVGGDLAVALTALGLDPHSDEGRALVRFAVSDEIAAMRRAMGQRS